jgi:SAM-dependent methyltransferase
MTVAPSTSLNPYPLKTWRRPSLGSRIRKLLRGIRWRFALGLVKTAFYVAKAGGRPYEPVEIGGRRFDNVRDSEGRWQAVAAVLKEYDVRNVLDVGCAEGWFVRRAATDLNCFAIGIEASDRMTVGELSRLYDRKERMATVKAFMNPDDFHSLPKFDAVICAHGMASAEEFISALATRVDRVLIFEIGTADEKSWTTFLPEVSQGQEAFVKDLLERCGFQNVRVIGESPAYHREVQRLLFAAEPTRGVSKPVTKSA